MRTSPIIVNTIIVSTIAVTALGAGAAVDAVSSTDRVEHLRASPTFAPTTLMTTTTTTDPIHPAIHLHAPYGTSAPADGATQLCATAVVTGTPYPGWLTVAIAAGPNAGPSQTVHAFDLTLCATSVIAGSDQLVATWTGPVLDSGEQLQAWPQQLTFEWAPTDGAAGGRDGGRAESGTAR
jgi:hypothetical protein